MKRSRFVVYQSTAKKDWRWRLVAANGETVAQNEGYPTKAHALRATRMLPRVAFTAAVRQMGEK